MDDQMVVRKAFVSVASTAETRDASSVVWLAVHSAASSVVLSVADLAETTDASSVVWLAVRSAADSV